MQPDAAVWAEHRTMRGLWAARAGRFSLSANCFVHAGGGRRCAVRDVDAAGTRLPRCPLARRCPVGPRLA